MPERAAAVVERIRDFLDAHVLSDPDLSGPERFREILPKLQKLRAKVREAGLWAPFLPEAWGGLGLPLTEFAHVSEALGRSPLGHYLFNCQAPDVGNMEVLLEFGTPEQQQRWLKPLAAGDIRSCFSMTEPEFAGSNPVHMATTAVLDGDEWVINGHKWFTTAADGAAFAIVMAITDPDAGPYDRASMIVVPTDTPGFELVRNISIMGTPGADHASHAEIRYTNCRVPRANLIGPLGSGFTIAQKRLGPGRIHHCMRWIGICERAFELMCERAATRELAPGRLLGTRQTIQNWIAESRVEIDAARYLVVETARRIDEVGSSGARAEISAIKFHVAGVLQRVVDRAIQVHGALGITDDLPLAWWYAHERGARIYDGPDEVHKTVVARNELKRYGVDVR
ncbi:MAG: acyl-CoA dehydrogenase [Candidatus Dadabacteria bacterium]|nr:MAG: acyl-CoA dehydrogenase [Candidatus Dadabacteria bacterium]